nr:PREDICTED: uncharacterized protein LOC109034977 isoform X2 [Bemisia tabaci]
MAVLLYSFICMLIAELLNCGKMVFPKRSFKLEDVSQALRAANLSAADIPCMTLTSKDFQRLCESLNVDVRSLKVKKILRKFLLENNDQITSLQNPSPAGTSTHKQPSLLAGVQETLSSPNCSLPIEPIPFSVHANFETNSSSVESLIGVKEPLKNLSSLADPSISSKIVTSETRPKDLSLEENLFEVVELNVNDIASPLVCETTPTIVTSETRPEHLLLDKNSFEVVELNVNDVASPLVCKTRNAKQGMKKRRFLKWPRTGGSILGCLTVPSEVLDRIWSWDNDKFTTRKYASLISNLFLNSGLSSCVLNVQSVSVCKRSITFYCYCAHENCVTFKLLSKQLPIRGERLQFTIIQFGIVNHAGRMKTRFINGFVRDDLKEVLASKSAFEVRENAIAQVPSSLIREGNLGPVTTLECFRKISSEYFAKDDLHPDVMINLLMEWVGQMKKYLPDNVEVGENTESEDHLFLQRVGFPFFGFLQCVEELELFATHIADNLGKGKGPVLHLDATSSLVKPYKIPSIRTPRCFYYSLSFGLRGKLCTLASAWLSQQDTCRISGWLLEVRAFLEAHKHWPIKNNLIVTDTSFPLLYSVLLVFNTMTLINYLQFCHTFVNTEVSKRNTVLTSSITVIKNCCSHKIKNFAQHVSSAAPQIAKCKDSREFILKCIGTFFMCEHYEVLKMMFEKLFIILLSEKKDEDLSEAIKYFENLFGEPESVYLSTLNEVESDADFNYILSCPEAQKEEEDFSEKALYLQSPFYKDMNTIFQQVIKFLTEKNNFKSNRPTDFPVQASVIVPSQPVPDNFKSSHLIDTTQNPPGHVPAQPNPSTLKPSPPVCVPTQSKANNLKPSQPANFKGKVSNLVTVMNLNQFCSPNLADTLLKLHCATIPLWTGIVRRPLFPNDPIRFSNSYAEGWIKNAKQDIFRGQRNIRANRIVKGMRRHVVTRKKEVSSGILPTPCAHTNRRKSKVLDGGIKKPKKPKTPKKSIVKKYNKTKPIVSKLIPVTSPQSSAAQKPYDFPPFSVEEQWRRKGTQVNNLSSFLPKVHESLPSLSPSTPITQKTVTNANVVNSNAATTSTHNLQVFSSTENGFESQIDKCTSSSENELLQYSPLNRIASNRKSALILTNGMFLDPEFYVPLADLEAEEEEDFNYFVAKFGFHPLGGIKASDFDSLRGNKSLSFSVIDALAGLTITAQKEKNFSLIPCLFSNAILDGKVSLISEDIIRKTYHLQEEYIVMFYENNRSHWSLIIIHLPSRTFYLLDPLENHTFKKLKQFHKYLVNFITFFSVSQPQILSQKEWTVSTIQHPIQKDFANSSVFCLFYLEGIVKQRSLPKRIHNSSFYINGSRSTFDPAGFRSQLLMRLLLKSESVKNICISCGKENDGSIKHCINCTRFCHQNVSCLKMFYEVSSTCCRLCDRYEVTKNTSQPINCSPRNETELSPSAVRDSDSEKTLSADEERIESIDDDHLFYRDQYYLKAAIRPEYPSQPSPFSNRFISSSLRIPKVLARNPQPSLMREKSNKAPCFYSLPNGVVDKLNYYVPVPRPGRVDIYNYAVASFSFPSLRDNELFFKDYISLDDDQQVFYLVMDIVASLYIKLFNHRNLRIKYLSVEVGRQLLEGSTSSSYLDPSNADLIINILLRHGHYCLIIIDFRNNSLIFLDPKGGKPEKTQGAIVCAKFSKFTRKPLQLQIFEHTYQKRGDSENCGIYCLYFLERFLTFGASNIPFHDIFKADFSISAERKTIKRTLLWHSIDFSFVCRSCHIEDVRFDVARNYNTQKFIECMDCERPVHLKEGCLFYLQVEDVNSWEPEKFYCCVCHAYRSKEGKKGEPVNITASHNEKIKTVDKERRFITLQKYFARGENESFNSII